MFLYCCQVQAEKVLTFELLLVSDFLQSLAVGLVEQVGDFLDGEFLGQEYGAI
jgi:hypothetical protein